MTDTKLKNYKKIDIGEKLMPHDQSTEDNDIDLKTGDYCVKLS